MGQQTEQNYPKPAIVSLGSFLMQKELQKKHPKKSRKFLETLQAKLIQKEYESLVGTNFK